jgi:hypothetical protein
MLQVKVVNSNEVYNLCRIYIPLKKKYRSRYRDGLNGRDSIPGKEKIFFFSTAYRPALGTN